MSTAATLGYCFAFLFVCQNALWICKLWYWHSFSIFEAFPGQTFQLLDLEIQNTVANASIDLADDEFLDLERFYSDHSRYCTYQEWMRACARVCARAHVYMHALLYTGTKPAQRCTHKLTHLLWLSFFFTAVAISRYCTSQYPLYLGIASIYPRFSIKF